MAHTMLDYALRYRRRGFSVIPCRKDKKPYVKWEQYQHIKASEEQIRKWFGEEYPNANIGIVCGPVSGVDVLDLDSQQAFETVSDFYLPDSFQTPTVKTPKGRHLYFKHRPGLSNAVRVVAGTDLRTFGGYVVAPPSKNGEGSAYHWFDGLTPKDCEFAPWPDDLFQTLLQCSTSPNNNTCNSSLLVTSNSNDHATPDKLSTTVYKTGQFFTEGRRDQDIFHVANCLIKGRCEKELVYNVLQILAKNCKPAFDEKEIHIKIESAMQRKEKRDGNLSAEVRDWVLSTSGNFLSTAVYSDLQLSTRDERKNVSIILKRLADEGLIEKTGSRNGEWRMIDQDCKPESWLAAECSYKNVWFPLGIGDFCGLLPGNIAVIAGSKDAGKTAFLLNIAKNNRHDYKIHYINSEMGNEEFLKRVKLFDDITPDMFSRNFNLYTPKSMNFSDYVKPGDGNLNIIDYLEAPDEVWRIGPMIRKIHEKLNGALCVIGIQKKIGQDLGRGAEFSMEKARLYVSLEYGKAKIISCKNFKENELIQGNPRGYTCQYKLVNGCKIIKQAPGWTGPAKKEA